MVIFTVPEWISPPEVSALSSTSLRVEWNSSEGHGVVARGHVVEYQVSLLTEQTNNPHAPPLISQVNHYFLKFYPWPDLKLELWQNIVISSLAFPFQVVHRTKPSAQSVYVVKGLKPYHMYNFTVTVCTKTGCITSLPGEGRTLPAGKNKESFPHPSVHSSTDIFIHSFIQNSKVFENLDLGNSANWKTLSHLANRTFQSVKAGTKFHSCNIFARFTLNLEIIFHPYLHPACNILHSYYSS